MTNEEKLELFYENSLEMAKAEVKKKLQEHENTLRTLLEDHKEEKKRQADTELRAEEQKLRHDNNAQLASEQLKIRHQIAEKTHEIREMVFTNLKESLRKFKKTEDYRTYLLTCIRKAISSFQAEPEEITFYMAPSDRELLPEIARLAGVQIELAGENFLGGMMARRKGKNILLDDSFDARLSDAWEHFSLADDRQKKS